MSPQRPRLPPLPRLELLAVLLPIFSTALPCSLFPALDDCVGLTCLRSRCAQDRWQLEIGVANGGVEGRLEAVARTSPSTCSEALVPWHDRRNAFLSSSWQGVRAPVAREPLHITLRLIPRLTRHERPSRLYMWSRILRAQKLFGVLGDGVGALGWGGWWAGALQRPPRGATGRALAFVRVLPARARRLCNSYST